MLIFGQLLSRRNMSTLLQQTFGEKLRKLRENDGMPLRRLAALLDIDQSTLSKIERSERQANLDIIEKLAIIFQINYKDLYVSFITDKVANELLEEESLNDILKVVKEKIEYLKSKRKP